jgi:hypothetical protein
MAERIPSATWYGNLMRLERSTENGNLTQDAHPAFTRTEITSSAFTENPEGCPLISLNSKL